MGLPLFYTHLLHHEQDARRMRSISDVRYSSGPGIGKGGSAVWETLGLPGQGVDGPLEPEPERAVSSIV